MITDFLQAHFQTLSAVLLSTAVAQFISALWFGPFFSKQWQKYCGWTEIEYKNYLSNKSEYRKSIVGAFLEQLVSVIVFAVLLHYLNITETAEAIKLAGLVWFGFMATASVNEVLWHGERVGFYVLTQSSYLVRTIAVAAVYSFVALQ